MKKRNKIIIAGILSAGVIGSAAAYGKFHRHGHHAEYLKYKLTDELSLNDAQAGKIDSVADAMMSMRKQFGESRHDTMKQVVKLLESDQLDETQAMQLVRERTLQIENNAQTMIAAVAGFTNSLDATQRMTLRDMVNDRLEWKGHHRKHGHGQYGDRNTSE